MQKGINLSRFKIYTSDLLNSTTYRPEMADELAEFKKTRKNIGSIVTTNYDTLIEETFEFNPLVGNNILLSNPYGSVYKIHGCVSDPLKLIIQEHDYEQFDKKYELIRAQLLSLFIHNPIIFLGYNVGDDNIKKILKTIFTYVEANSKEAERIRNNFLLVEFSAGDDNVIISDHDIDIEGFSTIRINKVKTDNYTEIYKSLAQIHLPISAMDIRKVQTVVNEIYAGGQINVTITEDLDSLKNSDKIIAIGSTKTISYQYHNANELLSNYFKILDESNNQILNLIDQYTLSNTQYFPIFGFAKINSTIQKADKLKEFQKTNLEKITHKIPKVCQKEHDSVDKILNDGEISNSNKTSAILWGIMYDHLELKDVEKYLRSHNGPADTNFRKLICAYDLKKYS